MKDYMNDITAVTVNWLSAENTKRAVLSVRKFYPDIPVIVVDDDSNPKDKTLFFTTYSSSWNKPELMYDPDTDKLKSMKNITFLLVPPYEHVEAKGHGKAVDMAIKHIKTGWMFHFHSDWRMTGPGILEEMTFGLTDDICGVGDNKTRDDRFPALNSTAALYNVAAGKLHHVTFQPVVTHPDGTVSPFPGPAGLNDIPIEAGSYFIGRLCQLGYKRKSIANPYSRYGIHLRWSGDIDEWNQNF